MRGGPGGPVMSLGSCLVPLSAKRSPGGGGEKQAPHCSFRLRCASPRSLLLLLPLGQSTFPAPNLIPSFTQQLLILPVQHARCCHGGRNASDEGSALSKPHSSWGRPTINKRKFKELQIIILALTWSWGNSHPMDKSQRSAFWGNAI